MALFGAKSAGCRLRRSRWSSRGESFVSGVIADHARSSEADQRNCPKWSSQTVAPGGPVIYMYMGMGARLGRGLEGQRRRHLAERLVSAVVLSQALSLGI